MAKRVDYQKVAEVYRAAVLRGDPPTKAVREAFDICQSTAGQRVQRARQAGLLPEASGRGEHLTRNRRALLVADALGVEYDALVAAIHEHAEGDLRLA